MGDQPDLQDEVWSSASARRSWRLMVERNFHREPHTFDFVFYCADESSAQDLATYLRRDGKTPVSIEVRERYYDQPAVWSVRGHTPHGVPTEVFLIALYSWIRDTARRFNCECNSLGF